MGLRLYSIFPLSVQRRPCGSPTGSSELSSICDKIGKKNQLKTLPSNLAKYGHFSNIRICFFSNIFPTPFQQVSATVFYGDIRNPYTPNYPQILPNTVYSHQKSRKCIKVVAKLVRFLLVTNFSNLQECEVALNLASTELQVLNWHGPRNMR